MRKPHTDEQAARLAHDRLNEIFGLVDDTEAGKVHLVVSSALIEIAMIDFLNWSTLLPRKWKTSKVIEEMIDTSDTFDENDAEKAELYLKKYAQMLAAIYSN